MLKSAYVLFMSALTFLSYVCIFLNKFIFRHFILYLSVCIFESSWFVNTEFYEYFLKIESFLCSWNKKCMYNSLNELFQFANVLFRVFASIMSIWNKSFYIYTYIFIFCQICHKKNLEIPPFLKCLGVFQVTLDLMVFLKFARTSLWSHLEDCN